MAPITHSFYLVSDSPTHYKLLLSWVISWKEKMCMENDFNNFFEVASGQLKSRVCKKSFKRFLKKCDLKFFTYKSQVRFEGKITKQSAS